MDRDNRYGPAPAVWLRRIGKILVAAGCGALFVFLAWVAVAQR